MRPPGAVTEAMLDAAIPAACLREARAKFTARAAGWIGHVVAIVQAHNGRLVAGDGCSCGSQNLIVWDHP